MKYFKKFRRKIKAPFKAVWKSIFDNNRSTSTQSVLTSIKLLTKLKLEQFLLSPQARMHFPRHEAPDISVLVILYNKAEYTYQCLETLLANTNVSYEVILVDNGSTDETHRLLDRLDNVTVVRNTTNKGFLLACNQAADLAQGKWLLLLNNDIQAPPTLLSTLLDTTKGRERCGAVGAKLILTDGTLQEAGSIIWKDGSCLGYGRGDNPNNPQYSYLKEVDYCSGACLLVRSDLFREAGKFDERYVPAYYEESDLCMSLRKMGYEVLYQPAANVIHYEFGSSSSSKEACALHARNQGFFVKKWKQELATHHDNKPKNIIAARERLGKKKKILIVDDIIPDGTLGCGYPRSHDILEVIRELGYAVTFFPLAFPDRPEPCSYNLQQNRIEAFYGPASTDFESFFRARKKHYDVIWISRPHNMERIINIVRSYNSSQKVIYDAEAFFAARQILMANLLQTPIPEATQKELIKKEITLMRHAQAIVTVSERERATFENLGCQNINVIGHTYSIKPTETSFEKRCDILFVGSFLTPGCPNEDAILHFCKEVFPLVQKTLKIKLWIAGTHKLDSIKNLASENIVVTGRVDDLRPFYEKSRVFIVPTRFAAGIPFKLQEAMAYGIPTVVSPLIADQLGQKNSILLVGENPQDFAAKIIKCYTEPVVWSELRQNALQYIKTECSLDTYRERIKSVVDDVLS